MQTGRLPVLQENQEMKIIRDTREQQPLKFVGYDCKIVVDKLDAADYSMAGADRPGTESILFERKADCSELLRNIGANWETFEAELKLMALYEVKAIVVCENQCFGRLFDAGLTKLHPNFVYKRLAEIHINYNVPTLFFPTREHAENYIFRSFLEMNRRLRNA